MTRNGKARNQALNVLKGMMVACVIVPLGLLAYAAWTLDKAMHRDAEQRVEIELDVMTQHAQKVLQTAALTLQAMRLMTDGLSDSEVRAHELPLHAAMDEMARQMPSIQSIWLVSRAGTPLVSNLIAPVPPLDVRERDFFVALAGGAKDPFIGAVNLPKLPGPPFFAFASARETGGGSFNGALVVSLLPSEFVKFYAELDPDGEQLFTMVRADGAVLARFPEAGTLSRRLDPAVSPLMKALREHPQGGQFRAHSSLDGVERIVHYRPLPGYPVYLTAGVNTAAIHDRLLATLAGHLVFGVPATALLLVTLTIALRRTQRLHAEADLRQKVEQTLARRQRLEAIGQLTGGVAHDFNNLLMIVMGSAEQLRRGARDARDRHSLDVIEATVHRGAALTRQLLTFASRQALATEVIDLTTHLARFDDLMRRSLRGDIVIDLDLPSSPCRVKVDTGELELALLNIGVNARDAMPAGGRLTVKLRRVALNGEPAAEGLKGQFAAITLSDTGPGIPADVLARVFEPFFTTKQAGAGTGLGLSQVYGFARQSGGAATVESKPGHGTAVTIYLPVTTAAATATAPRAAAPAMTDSGGHSILMVEDNAEMAEVQRTLLEDCGYRVDCVPDADAALAWLSGPRRADIVLSDIVMPGEMNGIDLARTLRRRFPGLPVILASGYSAGAEDAIREGFVFLQKPYGMAKLREILAAQLGKTATQRQDAG